MYPPLPLELAPPLKPPEDAVADALIGVVAVAGDVLRGEPQVGGRGVVNSYSTKSEGEKGCTVSLLFGRYL